MSKYKKYPRTYHLPWSEGKTDDDKTMENTNFFNGKRVIVTEKMDGESCTMYNDHLHARSIDSANHPSRNWVKILHSQISYLIPENYRICGENLFAKHSIEYKDLNSYFTVHNIWENDLCLSWDKTVKFAESLNLELAPVLYDGIYDEKIIKKLFTGSSKFSGEQEGYVIRIADSFDYKEFNKCVGKFVRKNHVQTEKHWIHQEIEKNTLKGMK